MVPSELSFSTAAAFFPVLAVIFTVPCLYRRLARMDDLASWAFAVFVRLAGRILKWLPGEGPPIGWILQTRGRIMIVFTAALPDERILSKRAFTA